MSDNPLLTPRRRREVHLYSGEVEDALADYDERIEQAYAAEGSDVRKRGVSDALAKERDDYLASVQESAPRLVLEGLTERTLQRLYDEHPPREDNKLDKSVGYNRESFRLALVRAAIVEPGITDEQWREFCEEASSGRIARLHQVADELTGEDVDLPKFSAVTTLSQVRAREQRRRGDTG